MSKTCDFGINTNGGYRSSAGPQKCSVHDPPACGYVLTLTNLYPNYDLIVPVNCGCLGRGNVYGSKPKQNILEKATGNHSSTVPKKSTMAATNKENALESKTRPTGWMTLN